MPSAFLTLQRWPLTPNGKIDRRALPAPNVDNPSVKSRPYTPPRTKIEELLADLFAAALGLDRVSVDDNFFELGGRSLLAIKAVSRIRDVFEVDLPLRTLFERPTVGALAEAIDALAWLAKAKAPTRGAIDREEIEV